MKFLLIPMMFAGCAAYAQTLDRQVIGSAGSYANGGTFNVSMTVGEPVTATAITGTITLTQGFQQPDDILLDVRQPVLALSYTVFPNPTQDNITVHLTAESALEVSLSLFDAAGKLVKVLERSIQVNGTSTYVYDLSELAAGTYYLTFFDLAEKKLESVAIQKFAR